MIVSSKISQFEGLQPVITIGFFDGVHLGHKRIIDETIKVAHKERKSSLVITFWPHPRIVLKNDAENLRLLSSLSEKQELLKQLGVDGLLIINFTTKIAKQPAVEFLQQSLVGKLNISAAVLGYNHAFGYKGQGNYNLFKQHEEASGYQTIQIQPVKVDGIDISSTKIRQALSSGDLDIANNMLGYYYSLQGTIEGGQQIGRNIGYPTANIKPVDILKLVPADGVYAVWVDYEEKSYPAMLNIGIRPTIGDGLKRTIEAHIIGFNKNIYNRKITVRFVKKTREELRFSSLELLKNQLDIDKQTVLNILGI